MKLDDFFEKINSILEGPKFSDHSYQVFRGHSKSSYKLLPTLLRCYLKTGKPVWKLENNLYCEFRSLIGSKVKFDSSWQTLFAMRHEGIPTRLLDWTENIGTALHFALDSDQTAEPHIWILNPFALNQANYGERVLINPEEDLSEYHLSYVCRCFDERILIKELPFAIYPNRSNDRMFAQKGLFTIHGTDESEMEQNCSSYLEKIIIPDEIIPKLKKLLLQFGINKYSVYPDFKGLSDFLKDTYRY